MRYTPIVLVLIVALLLAVMVLWYGSSVPAYTLTAGCVSYEGCGYTTKIKLRIDSDGLIRPPSDRFCPKCGKIIFYVSVDGNDLINQRYERETNEEAQIQDR